MTTAQTPGMFRIIPSVVRYQPKYHPAWTGDVIGLTTLGEMGHPTEFPDSPVMVIRPRGCQHVRHFGPCVELEIIG